MANLYLVDKRTGPQALSLAAADSGASVVLLQDGVYLDASAVKGKVYAVKQDVELRGMASRVPGSVQLIDYGALVDLILANKVVNLV
ncbi:MAG: DsrH/TusB family sulfur metabolism protein [Dehalococcoidia bacterium]